MKLITTPGILRKTRGLNPYITHDKNPNARMHERIDFPRIKCVKDMPVGFWSTFIRESMVRLSMEGQKHNSGVRVVIDCGVVAQAQMAQVHFILSKEAPLPTTMENGRYLDYPFHANGVIKDWNALYKHSKANALYRKANGLYPVTKKMTSRNFAMFPSSNPRAVIDSLIVAKGPYTCPLLLPKELWAEFGLVVRSKIEHYTSMGLFLHRGGYRIIINNGPWVQTTRQMHAHFIAGALGMQPVFDLERSI
ncbi:MAG: hypothetical protein HQ564_09870 [Candidatus Saganbacteria bacterium]|nr:hypothetical protein [Candidatus Saganbacteria bacterium]